MFVKAAVAALPAGIQGSGVAQDPIGSFALQSYDNDASDTARSGLLFDNDLDVMVNGDEQRHEPFNRKASQLIVSQSRHFRL